MNENNIRQKFNDNFVQYNDVIYSYLDNVIYGYKAKSKYKTIIKRLHFIYNYLYVINEIDFSFF